MSSGRLNPDAQPWSAPTSGTPYSGQQDSHYYPHHHPQHYYGQQHIPLMMHPSQQQSRHQMVAPGNYPSPMHPQHQHMYQNQRPRVHHLNSTNVGHHPILPAPSYKKPDPMVVLVLGYSKVGKTTVAKRLAESRQYKYLSLKSEGNEVQTPEQFVSELVELVGRKSTFDGIVIDDAIIRSKFDPYYVQAVLQKHGLRIDVAVVLDNDLDHIKDRCVNYDDPLERQKHPEGYEFCANFLQGNDIVVVNCQGKTPDDVFNDALRQMKDVSPVKETFLTLKEVELMAKCPLETNPMMVTKIIKDESHALNMSYAALFPFSEPNYLLDYAVFARNSYAFRNYLITPWIQGDKVSLIGHQYDIYIHLPTYNIVFRFMEPPPSLKQLAVENKGPGGISFILEATFAEDKLYISDLLMLGELKGSGMLVNERVKVLSEKLSDLDDPEGTVCLLPWYPVKSIELCVEQNQKASGVLFINPDGIAIGCYDSRNFLYPLRSKKSVELRIWNGKFNSGQWTFDAFCEDPEGEKLIENVPVHISDTDVNKYCINDGNILECIREDYNLSQNKGKKGAVQRHFVFRRRCNWMLNPTTVYKQENFVDDPKWPLERMKDACATIEHVPATRPEGPTETDEQIS